MVNASSEEVQLKAAELACRVLGILQNGNNHVPLNPSTNSLLDELQQLHAAEAVPGPDQPLKLDSRKPTIPLEQFTMKEGRFAMLAQADPVRAKQLAKAAQAEADARWQLYEQIAGVHRVVADAAAAAAAPPAAAAAVLTESTVAPAQGAES